MPRLRILALLLCSSCAIGAPPGFNSADSWSVPIVQPLDDSTLLVPVEINGKGPFLFALNTDWQYSSMDMELAAGLGLRMTRRGDAVTSRDNLEREIHVEVKSMSMGDLTVSRPRFRARQAGHRPYPGLRVYGNIGRDILADSLSLTIDRDRGMAYLATAGHGPKRGEETKVVKLQKRRGLNWRMLAKAQIDGDTALLFIDLANQQSRIRPAPAHNRSTTVSIAGAEARDLELGTFDDRRIDPEDYNGSLGQDYLAHFRVSIDFHRKQLWLDPRSESIAKHTRERLQRWGTQFDKCEKPACVGVEVAPPGQDSQSGEWLPLRLVLTREAPELKDYEVILKPHFEGAQSLKGGLLRVTLPSGMPTLSLPLGGPLQDASSFEIVDASPFPRPCRGGQCMSWVSMPQSRISDHRDHRDQSVVYGPSISTRP